MTRMIFVRHGQSEANVVPAFAGWTDAPLTEKGHKQAEAAAEYLLKYKIDVAYASDLQRAFCTARHIADKQNVTVIPEPAFREIFAGEWENRPYAELVEAYPVAYTTWLQDIGHAQPTGGETVAELQARVAAAVARILEKHKGETVLIGTHATPVRVMECIWRGLPLSCAKDVKWVPNASATVVEYDDAGHATPVLLGCADYLSGDLLSVLPKNV